MLLDGNRCLLSFIIQCIDWGGVITVCSIEAVSYPIYIYLLRASNFAGLRNYRHSISNHESVCCCCRN